MKYIAKSLLLVVFSFSFHFAQAVEPTILAKVNKTKMNQWVDSIFNSMSSDQKIGQLIMVIADGNASDFNKKRIKFWLDNDYIGGILFSSTDPLSQVELTNYVQKSSKVPLLVGLDGEWGLAMRLVNTTRFPKNMMLGSIKDDSLIYNYGKEVARQCRLMGIQVNFAPDMDVNSNPNNPVIGVRSFGEDPNRVARLGILYAKGLEDGGVLSVAKHFPGHGNTSTDSHKTLPVITRNKEQLEKFDIAPFRAFVQSGLGGVMIAHLNIPALDSLDQPSSLSKNIVQKLLKDDLGFQGLVFTDGLEMRGVSRESDMSLRALLAGDDILLGPTNPTREFNAIKEALAGNLITQAQIDEKCRKILQYKYALGLNVNLPVKEETLMSDLNSLNANRLNRELNENAITLLKNKNDILPFKHLDKRTIAQVTIGDNPDEDFASQLHLYGNVTHFEVSDNSRLASIDSQIADFNTLILNVNSKRRFNSESLAKLCAGKEVIINFFTTPYEMSNYKEAIDSASAVICAYENTPYAQMYAAQGIFGGISMNATLPVSVNGIFKEGDGLITQPARLGYEVPEKVGVSSLKLTKIDQIVQDGLDAKAFPGCQVLVAKDGKVIYNKAFGYSDYTMNKHKMSVNDLYDLASMTKSSATLPAIMKIFDENKVELTDYMSKYVTQLQNTDKQKLTLRDALFHETGLKPFLPFYMDAIDKSSYQGSLISGAYDARHTVEYDAGTWVNPDFRYLPDLVASDKKEGFNLTIARGLYGNEKLHDLVLEDIAKSTLSAKKYQYSDLNFILLKEVLEKVSGQNLNEFLQTDFYRKLGASTTTFLPLERVDSTRIAPTENDQFLRKQLLRGYVDDEAAAFQGGISGNAGLFSSANDLAKLYQMWLNGGTYGGEEFLQKSTCDLFTKSKSAISRRGLGFDKPDPTSHRMSPCSENTPASVYGHTGFTGTCFWIDPDNNLIYIFLSNRVNESRINKKIQTMGIRSRIQEAIYNSLIPANQ